MMTITFATWWFPLLITVVGLAWAFFWVGRDDWGMFAGLGTIFALVPVLALSAISWALWGIFK